MSPFTKPAIDVPAQLELLKQRGLTIQDEARAICFLKAVSFFRLTPYMRPFQHPNQSHTFKAGAGFRQISRLYDFDRRLRLLVIDAVERTEVAVRAQMSNTMGVQAGTHWYLDRQNFSQYYDHARLLDTVSKKQKDALDDYRRDCQRIDRLNVPQQRKAELKQRRQQESYARHYALTYSSPSLMPNWAIFEELTLGELSHLYKGLARDTDKKRIAAGFDLPMPLLESWLHTLTLVRNICAHHGRLWNRELGVRPAQPRQLGFVWPLYLQGVGQQHTRIAVVLAVLQHFMQRVSPNTSWHQRLFELFAEFPEIDPQAMGMPVGWQHDQFWKV